MIRTARPFEAAGGISTAASARFFSSRYLGWFISPWVLFVTTTAAVIVTWRRQFASNTWRAMALD